MAGGDGEQDRQRHVENPAGLRGQVVSAGLTPVARVATAVTPAELGKQFAVATCRHYWRQAYLQVRGPDALFGTGLSPLSRSDKNFLAIGGTPLTTLRGTLGDKGSSLQDQYIYIYIYIYIFAYMTF